MAGTTDRSTCIWCARVLVPPAVPCSHLGAADRERHFSIGTDQVCLSVLSDRMTLNAMAAISDKVPLLVPERS